MNLYLKNRLITFIISALAIAAYITFGLAVFDSIYYWGCYGLLTIIFAISIFDTFFCVSSMLIISKPETLNRIIGRHLWLMRYTPDESYVLQLSTHTWFEVAIFIPLIIVMNHFSFDVAAGLALGYMILNIVFGVITTTTRMNNSGYINE